MKHCDHVTESVFVTTRRGTSTTPTRSPNADAPVAWPNENDEFDEMDDLDLDIIGPYDDDDEGIEPDPPNDRLPAR